MDDSDTEDDVRVLLYLEHCVQDARTDRSGNRRVVSRQLQFVEISGDGSARSAGYAPYLDYRPATDEERSLVGALPDADWLRSGLEDRALSYAIAQLAPWHLQEVKRRKEALIDKTAAAVKDRLTKEINYWDHRAEELKAQELAGRTPRMNSARARQRADELEVRLRKRMEELEQERHLSALAPVVVGGALVVPRKLLQKLKSGGRPEPDAQPRDTARVERLAVEAVMAAERALGFEPLDVSAEKRGYDIESRVPGTGQLRFIEVKGRASGAKTITVTKNEILTGLNKPEDFVLAIVEVDGDRNVPRYIRRPFGREPDFGVTSVNYDLEELLSRARDPS